MELYNSPLSIVPPDIIVISEAGQRYYLHKTLLYMNSSTIKMLIRNKPEEKEIRLTVQDEDLDILMRFIYGERKELTIEEYLEVSPSAEYLGIDNFFTEHRSQFIGKIVLNDDTRDIIERLMLSGYQCYLDDIRVLINTKPTIDLVVDVAISHHLDIGSNVIELILDSLKDHPIIAQNVVRLINFFDKSHGTEFYLDDRLYQSPITTYEKFTITPQQTGKYILCKSLLQNVRINKYLKTHLHYPGMRDEDIHIGLFGSNNPISNTSFLPGSITVLRCKGCSHRDSNPITEPPRKYIPMENNS